MELRDQLTLLGHSTALTLFAPASNLFVLTRLYSIPFSPSLPHLGPLLPTQTLLRWGQINLSLGFKNLVSLWLPESQATSLLVFGALGILQGGVYGHANIGLTKALGLDSCRKGLDSCRKGLDSCRKGLDSCRKPTKSVASMFRGSAFAFGRDAFSQGLPFLMGNSLSSVLGWSVLSTTLSHPFHLGQTLMQAESQRTYKDVPRVLLSRLGPHIFSSGLSARIGLLGMTNLLNHYLLKDLLVDSSDE